MYKIGESLLYDIDNANNKGYFACQMEANESNPGIFFKPNQTFSEQFSADFWFSPNAQNFIIFNQDQSLKIESKFGKIYASFGDKAIGSFDIENNINMNGWNNLFLTYDKKTLTFYLQGVKISSFDTENIVLSENNIDIFKGFIGFLRCARFYNSCLTYEEVNKKIYAQNCKEDTDILIYIDFSTSNIATKGIELMDGNLYKIYKCTFSC